MKIKELVRFVDFLSVFPNIKRTNKIKGKGDFENDAEHSYQLALAAWYFADALGLPVRRQLVLEYALAHDLVEIYAGDTDAFPNNSEDDLSSKHQKEDAAFLRIKSEFPGFASLHESIERYEHRSDVESKLVYLVDKILPDINIFLSCDTYYKDRSVTFDDWQEWFKSKIEKVGIMDKQVIGLVDDFVEFQRTSNVFFKLEEK
jgi:5'-deoxynucleotidase YfbR-like HD superfamily hydrolase